MNEKVKILEFAEERFFKHGFYKTTMDQLASEMRMSKKTIYKYFPSKDDLVIAIVENFKLIMKNQIVPMLNSKENAVIKFTKLITILSKATARISDHMLNNLKPYFPDLWQEIEKFRTEMMINNISKVIAQGKDEGLIKDCPTPIIMTVFTSSIRAVVNPDLVLHNSFSIKQAIQRTFQILMDGILTEKGKKLFNKSINENE